ncbi:biotin-protein ligase [Dactylonectria macrodidyma]|uniref:Biotin-protein ligase n=1 Tax=Dactylonectria macrodidyma TaxID=307937 RepID=A0A9P9E103_9HYPO|nr:biotin-protein ligase [Dactylonectria macrodidyma]
MARKLNVLVYIGSGVSSDSAKNCMLTLRGLLFPKYAIIPIEETTIAQEPWAPSCALFVIPSSGDQPQSRVLNSDASRRIHDYVRTGGACLEFCSGGFSRCYKPDNEAERRSQDATDNQSWLPSFHTRQVAPGGLSDNDETIGTVSLKIRANAFKEETIKSMISYSSGTRVSMNAKGGHCTDADVLAAYDDEADNTNRAAVSICSVGDGKAMFICPQLEISAADLKSQIALAANDALIATLSATEASRLAFLRSCLDRLGIDASGENTATPALTDLHLSTIDYAHMMELLYSWEDISDRKDGQVLLRGGADIFQLLNDDADSSIPPSIEKAASSKDVTETAKAFKLIAYGTIPAAGQIGGNFDHQRYYSSLKKYRLMEADAKTWGDPLMFGEVVTSTNTLLEKNHELLARLPTGFTLAALTSVAARGRGKNVWIAPPGSIIFSTVIRHSAEHLMTRPIIFIQYLMSISIIEAVLSYGTGYENLPVKVKWPNDIYARDPNGSDEKSEYVKIGGFLTHCSYFNGSYTVVIGLGMNTLSPGPTTCIADLLPAGSSPLHVESLIARILTRLESNYAQFLREGFSSDLETRYYRHWLHSGQNIRLESEGGLRARVLGITSDWGMLRVEEVRGDGTGTGKIWALHNDENSFDYWKGLVRKKLL